MPEVNIPYDLHNALKNIYNQKQKSVSRNSDLYYNYIKCIKSLPNIQTITQRDYLIILKICLYLMQFEEDLEMKQCTLLNCAVKKSNLKNRFRISIESKNKDLSSFRTNYDVRLHDIGTKNVIFAKVVEVLENNIIIMTNSE